MFDYQELKLGHKKWTESADYKLYRNEEVLKEYRNRCLNIVRDYSNEQIPLVDVEELLGEIEPEKEKSSRLDDDLVINNWDEFQESGR